MKRFFIVLLSLCSLLGAKAQDYEALSREIAGRKLEHPYLVFDNRSKQAILERIAADPVQAQIWDLVQQQGRRLMLTAVEPEPFLDNDANVYNETYVFETFVGFYREGAKLLAFLYQMTGDEAYAQKAFHYADRLCEMTYWVLGLHRYKVIHKRVWPWGAGDDQVVFTYDLHTSEIALALGLVYDWTYPVLDKEQRNRIRSGLLENAILRVRGNYDYFWWSEAYRCNWTGSCYGGLGVAALALLTEDPKLTDVVARSCEGMAANLGQYGADNGWAEGRHYSIYGIRETIAFMEAIKRLSDGKVNLFQCPGWQHPADFGLYGMTGTFNDGFSPGPIGYSYFYNKFISENPDPAAMYYLETYFSGERRSMNFWELIWPRPTNVKAVKPAVASKHFPSIDWAFMRKDFGEENLQVALKCAPMNDPHHGHLDAGTFILSRQGDILVGEMEQKYYDQYFFTEYRWEYLHVRSFSHNVVQVNGEEQIPCKHKDGSWIDGLGGKIDKFYTSPAFDYTLMDPTNAYPKKELKGWKRAMVLDKETDVVLVLDRVSCAKGATIDLLFHPRVEATTDGRSARLQGKQSAMQMQPLVNSPYEVSLRKQYVVRVVKNDPMQIVPCIFTSLKAPAAENVIGTVFYPGGEQTAASHFALDQSGKHPVIRYILDGREYAYEFAPDQVKRL